MIANNYPSIRAYYRRSPNPGADEFDSHQIVGWGIRGQPLIVKPDGSVADADSLDGFVGVAEETQIVAIMPAGGWMVEFDDDEDAKSGPLAGWALQSDGHVYALHTDDRGAVEPVPIGSGGKYRVYHRSEVEPAEPEPARPARIRSA